jgi:hypothetical protein
MYEFFLQSIKYIMKKIVNQIALIYSVLTCIFFNKIIATTNTLIIYAIVTVLLMSTVLYINYIKKSDKL